MDDDDRESPGVSAWIWLVVGLLAAIGLFTVIHWAFVMVAGVFKLLVVVAIVVVLIAGIRSLTSRS